jgi:hypothetical protein
VCFFSRFLLLFLLAMDVDDHIEASGCAEVYRRMEDCIIEADRDWRKCQKQVREFKKCMEGKVPTEQPEDS